MREQACQALAVALISCSVWAQERGSDGVPAPVFDRNPVYPVPVLLEGRIAMGWTKASGHAPLEVGSPVRSYLRLRATETLDGGIQAHLHLEHSLNADSGRAEDEQRFWHGQATLGLSERSIGRADFGRKEQPAWGVALRLDPWGGNSVAAQDSWLYRGGPGRSDRSVTLVSSADWPLRLQLQSGRVAESDVDRVGGAMSYERGSVFAAAGVQHWGDGSRALPLGASYDFGTWKLALAHSRGRESRGDPALLRDYATTALGLTLAVMGKGEPRRHEFRAGLLRFAADAEQRQWRWSAGHRYRLSARTWLYANATVARPAAVQPRAEFDLGLVHQFGRDLRYPQEPR